MHHFCGQGELQCTVISQVARYRHVPVVLFPTREWPQKEFKRRLVAPTLQKREVLQSTGRRPFLLEFPDIFILRAEFKTHCVWAKFFMSCCKPFALEEFSTVQQHVHHRQFSNAAIESQIVSESVSMQPGKRSRHLWWSKFPMTDITRILSAIEQGDPQAAEELLPLVYAELRQLAAARLAKEKSVQTLQATALVHEAYLRLVEGEIPQHWSGRNHFYSAAAEAMRRILVDSARRKASLKHGGGMSRGEFDEAALAAATQPDELIAVNDALDELAAHDKLAADLVKLHYFGGFPLEEATELLGMSRATGYRLWTYARAWLRVSLQDKDGLSGRKS